MGLCRSADKPKRKFTIPQDLYSFLKRELELSEIEGLERIVLILGEIRNNSYHVTRIIPFEELRQRSLIEKRLRTDTRNSIRVFPSIKVFIDSLSSSCIFWAHTHIVSCWNPDKPSSGDLILCEELGISGLILYRSPMGLFELAAYDRWPSIVSLFFNIIFHKSAYEDIPLEVVVI